MLTSIRINSDLSSLAALQTLCHEILHARACEGDTIFARLSHDQKEAAAFAACDVMGLADAAFSAGFVLEHGRDHALNRIDPPDVVEAAMFLLSVLQGRPTAIDLP